MEGWWNQVASPAGCPLNKDQAKARPELAVLQSPPTLQQARFKWPSLVSRRLHNIKMRGVCAVSASRPPTIHDHREAGEDVVEDAGRDVLGIGVSGRVITVHPASRTAIRQIGLEELVHQAFHVGEAGRIGRAQPGAEHFGLGPEAAAGIDRRAVRCLSLIHI